jgi:hypothetical protein
MGKDYLKGLKDGLGSGSGRVGGAVAWSLAINNWIAGVTTNFSSLA